MPSRLPLVASLLLLGGCPSGLPDSLGDCADGTELTWADAGPVFAEHCADCHSSTLSGDARQGATEGVDFDTPDAARSPAFLAWSQIWTGAMPEGDAMEDVDALLLWEWLSCDGPE